jgi:Cu/Ag efflux protein CusF
MKPSAVRGTILRPFLLFTLLPLLAAGCAGKTEEKASGNTYTVKGRVRQVPAQGSGEFYLEHEPIDNYVARSGKVEGMDSMTMPFPVGKDVSLEGIQPEDIVEVQLHVDWDAEDRPVEITAIRELPPDTKLNFGYAKPPKP